MEEKETTKMYTEEEVKELIAENNKQAAQQLTSIYKRMQQLEVTQILQRLGVLFEIIKLGPDVFGDEFVKGCVDEVKQLIVLEDKTSEE